MKFELGTQPNFDQVKIENCQWTQRLGPLLNSGDKWWEINKETSIDNLSQEFITYIQTIIFPEIQRNVEDRNLRDLWLNRNSPGLTNIQRLINLSILLRELGPKSDYESIINELEELVKINVPITPMIRVHLSMLREEK